MFVLTPSDVEAKWKKLNSSNYRITSRATPRYNCLAFVFGDERHWWDHLAFGGKYFWPQGAQREWTLSTFIKIFEKDGYAVTENRNIEVGKQKVAIYVDVDTMEPSHFSISDGRTWKSKLGKLQDIDHDSLDILEGQEGFEYGIVERVFQRNIQ